MALERKNFTTPPGRLVQGDLYTPNTTDAEGRPLLVKNGPNAGQPRVDWFIALAIKKGSETHWAYTEWGAIIWQAGHAFLAHAGQLQDGFAWKVVDGDSQKLGKGKPPRRPCDLEGFPGHWVLRMSGGFQPGLYSLAGGLQSPVQLTNPKAINLGDFVQVNVDVVGNGSTQQPGVYLNPNMVCLLGYGPRISTGPDVASAGFGGVALPAGAMATPPGGFNPAQPQPPQMPGAPGAPQYPAPPGGAPIGVPSMPGPAMPPGMNGPAYSGGPAQPGAYPQPPAMPAPGGQYPAPPGGAPVGNPYPQPGSVPPASAGPANPSPSSAYAPTGGHGMFGPDGRPLPPQNPAFLQPPPGAAAPAGPQMTAAAQGSYADYQRAGWSDAQLRQHGLMV